MALNPERIRGDFPLLERRIGEEVLVYLDNAATSQKPKVVIDSLVDYYSNYNANIHRGVHYLSQEATDAYELARRKIQKHLNASKSHEIIFTSGTTHSINLIADSFSKIVNPGDEIVISALEHHSNIVPWQMLCDRTGAILRVIPMDAEGDLDMSALDDILSHKTQLVSCSHISNALGTVNPIEEIIEKAHGVEAAVFVDGAQACPHQCVDVQSLNVDFYAGSSHKMYGPTGVGFLYGKENWLEKLPPYQGGGEMIETVTFEKTIYAELPHKFEAGTPNISGGIAFGCALDYINLMGFGDIKTYEQTLIDYAIKRLSAVEGIEIYGNTERDRAPLVSFNLEGAHAYDVGSILDKMGIAVRTGHHCAQPIMDSFGISGTVRVSFAIYNTKSEIDRLIKGITKAKKMLI